MKLYFRPRVALVCGILFLACVRLSYWQYTRHQDKKEYIAVLNARLTEPIVPLTELMQKVREPQQWNSFIHRRVSVSGVWENEQEMLLRNRRLDKDPGGFVITPLRLSEGGPVILVSRGFVPFAFMEPSARKQFQVSGPVSFLGLIKESSRKEFLAPADPPTGPGLPWVDRWLRIDIPAMARQLPYPVLPVFLEIMETTDGAAISSQITSPKDGRAEMVILPSTEPVVGVRAQAEGRNYPVPVFDTVIPPGRHFGYIFEWLFIGILVLLVGVLIMRNPIVSSSQHHQ